MNILILLALLFLPSLANAADEFVFTKQELVKFVNKLTSAEAQHRLCEQKVLLLVEASDHQRKIIELERSDKEDLVKAVEALREHNASADEILAAIRAHVDKLAAENEGLRSQVNTYRWATIAQTVVWVFIAVATRKIVW